MKIKNAVLLTVFVGALSAGAAFAIDQGPMGPNAGGNMGAIAPGAIHGQTNFLPDDQFGGRTGVGVGVGVGSTVTGAQGMKLTPAQKERAMKKQHMDKHKARHHHHKAKKAPKPQPLTPPDAKKKR